MKSLFQRLFENPKELYASENIMLALEARLDEEIDSLEKLSDSEHATLEDLIFKSPISADEARSFIPKARSVVALDVCTYRRIETSQTVYHRGKTIDHVTASVSFIDRLLNIDPNSFETCGSPSKPFIVKPDRSYILPLNMDNCHWTSLVISRAENKIQIIFLDSADYKFSLDGNLENLTGTKYSKYREIINQKFPYNKIITLRDLIAATNNLSPEDISYERHNTGIFKQNDGVSCGPMSVENAVHVAIGTKISSEALNISPIEIRKKHSRLFDARQVTYYKNKAYACFIANKIVLEHCFTTKTLKEILDSIPNITARPNYDYNYETFNSSVTPAGTVDIAGLVKEHIAKKKFYMDGPRAESKIEYTMKANLLTHFFKNDNFMLGIKISFIPNETETKLEYILVTHVNEKSHLDKFNFIENQTLIAYTDEHNNKITIKNLDYTAKNLHKIYTDMIFGRCSDIESLVIPKKLPELPVETVPKAISLASRVSSSSSSSSGSSSPVLTKQAASKCLIAKPTFRIDPEIIADAVGQFITLSSSPEERKIFDEISRYCNPDSKLLKPNLSPAANTKLESIYKELGV